MRTAYFPLIGRLGNLLFQYAHARAWCEQNEYALCTDPWIGEKIFTIPESVRPGSPDKVFPEHYHQDQDSLIYTRKQVREWFTIRPEILERLAPVDKIQTKVVLNLRQGPDYVVTGLPVLDINCYLEAAGKAGYIPENSLIGIEADTNPTRLPEFEGDIWASGQNTTMAALPSFYRLITAPVLFRANSTFSWWAATLGNGRVFAPVIKDLIGLNNQFLHHAEFVEGNWPQMTKAPINTDLHLKEE